MKNLTLSAPFLAGQTLILIHDQPDRAFIRRDITVGSDSRFELALESAGGAVLFQQFPLQVAP